MANRGAAELAAICVDGPARRRVAALCDVTEQAVRLWATAATVPEYRNRKALQLVTEIDIDAWDEEVADESATG